MEESPKYEMGDRARKWEGRKIYTRGEDGRERETPI
jgi:hypothetical protein